MSVVDVLLVKCHRFYVKNVHFPQKKSENVAEMYIAKCSPIVHKFSSFSCNQDQTNFKNSGNLEVAAQIMEYLLNSY